MMDATNIWIVRPIKQFHWYLANYSSSMKPLNKLKKKWENAQVINGVRQVVNWWRCKSVKPKGHLRASRLNLYNTRWQTYSFYEGQKGKVVLHSLLLVRKKKKKYWARWPNPRDDLSIRSSVLPREQWRVSQERAALLRSLAASCQGCVELINDRTLWHGLQSHPCIRARGLTTRTASYHFHSPFIIISMAP